MSETESKVSKQVKSYPPGGVKLAAAMRHLLKNKDFNSITTSEISKEAGVNEALIYRYFDDKRGLLHAVLAEYWSDFSKNIEEELKILQGSLNKIRTIITRHIEVFNQDRVIAKILLLEVRNYPGYFNGDTYLVIKEYSGLLMRVIKEGQRAGEIRDDLLPERIRDLIFGGIEHFSMTAVIFRRPMKAESLAEDLCSLVFGGVQQAKQESGGSA